MMIKEIEKFAKNCESKINFDYDIKKLNWFNIGGKAQIYFKPKSLKDLINFLKIYKKNGKIFVLGAGSNVLFTDDYFEGVVIKLGKNFSNITQLDKNTIIAGSGVMDKNLSEFAKNSEISGLEFLSCIPGSVGGGIRMNSGCFGSEFKDVLISVQFVDFFGNVKSLSIKDINFNYRSTDLPKDLIFLSATFKGKHLDKNIIQETIIEMKKKKDEAQPSKIKTGGSTFKNPINQTKKKVWELIESSVSSDIKFGDAIISQKHKNFFINTKNAKYQDMLNLINHVKSEVKKKTGVDLDLEIVLVN